MTITQIVLAVFLIFAQSRVYLRFRSGEIALTGLLFWSIIFASALVGVVFPDITTKIAQITGIGRGVDVVVYSSIALLFYLVFRLYVYLEETRHEISQLVTKLALKDGKKEKKKETANN